MSYPVIYAETATDFFNLGLGTLPDATKVEVTEERNGEFTLSMTYLVDGLRANEIKKNRIIKVDAGHVLKGQRFVIKKINRQLVDKQLQLQVYAEHVSYITNDLQLKPNVSVNGSGDAAIKAWRSNIIDVNPLVVDSDIETSTSTTWTIDKVQSARQALGGVSGSLLDLWGGEYRFDNYHISLKKQRGTVANTLLSYGRNITDFDQEENITDTYTTVYPYATYAETTTTDDNASSESKLMTLPELTVDSEYVGNYPNRKILPVDLTSKFVDNEKPTIDKLREYAKAYVKSNSIGIPTVSIKLSYVDLSQSSNYEALKLLEVLDLCDTVPVRFSKLGVDTKTKVSRVVWDVLAEHYTSMELGDTRYTIGDMINNALNTANEANQNSQEAQNSANHAVVSADGHAMIFYGPNTPVAKNVGDLWYQPDGEYETMYRWDGVTWAFVMSTRDTADAQKAADAAQKEAEEAKNQANKAVDGANDAVAKAGFANNTATQAKSDAAEAGQSATTALTNAGTALTNAKNALDNVTKLDQTVKTEVTNINGQLAQKVSQTTFDTLKGTVTSQGTLINQNKDAIKLKADQTYVDTIKGTVANNTAAIDLNSKEIKLKASQSDVDKLGGQVTDAEAQIKLQADQIKLTVSKTELTNVLGDYATQTWTQGQIKSTADSINLSVSKVQSNLDNLAIGGRNYLADTSTTWQAQGSGGANQVRSWYFTFGTIKRAPFNDGDYVTVSFDYISVGTGAYGTIRAQFNDTPWGSLGGADAMKDNGHVVRTVQWKSGWTTSGLASGIQVRMDNVATTRTVTAYNMQFERGNKDTDHKVAPEDMATEVQFSQLQVTVNGIQGTVQNKADQSQITQLADQITSVVGARNLVVDSGLSDINNTWSISTYSSSATTRNDFWQGVDGGGSGNTLLFQGTNFSDSKWSYAKSRSLDAHPYTKLSASVMVWAEAIGNGAAFKIEFYDSAGLGINDGVSAVVTDNSKVKVWQTLKAENVAVPSNAATVRLTLFVIKNGNFSFLHPMMNIGAKALPYSASDFAQSQITQLANDINLRVEKDKVVNQINISPEGILIDGQKVHITGLTRIDNAVIKDAMISDIKADKITAGTLNAANVNVINLNAANITTGTIKGANLSMNLNTGEVLFQKGSIRSTNGNLNIHIDDGSMSLTNSLGNGAYFKDGNIYMTDSDFWTPGNPKIQYGTLKMVPNFMSDAGGGVALKGPNGVVVGTDKYSDTGIVGDLWSSSPGGGITLTKEHIRMASEGDIGIAGGKMYNSVFGGQLPAIQVGIAGSHTEPTRWSPSSKTGDALFLSGKVVGVVADGGTGDFLSNNISDLSVAGDARSGYVLSAATYKRTYGSGDTVTITPNGVFGRISSASKYKLAIGEISALNDEAHQFLSVKPKQWFDKSESEALADSMTTGNTDYVDDAKALPHNGFIAEDLYTAGLDSYVIRSNDGSIESIQYDRLPVLHHELIRELFNRLDAAEMEIYKLKQEVLNNAN